MRKWLAMLLSMMIIVSLSFQTVDAASLKITSFSASSYGYVNSSMKLSVKVKGGKGSKKYKYYYKLGKKTTIIKNYSTSKSVSFKPKKAGKYTLYVTVKDKSKTVTKSRKVTVYSAIKPKLSLNKTYMKQNSKKTNYIKATASATGGYTTKKKKLQYQFTVYKVTKKTIDLTTKKIVNTKIYTKKYSSSKSLSYKPTKGAGTYKVTLSVKDAHSKVASVSKIFYVCTNDLSSKITCNGVNISKEEPYEASLGEKVEIKINASGGVKDYEYLFKQIDDETGEEVSIYEENYSNINVLKFTAEELGGTYHIIAYVKDAGGKVVRKPIDITVKDKVSVEVKDCQLKNGEKVKLDYTPNFKYKKRVIAINDPTICSFELVENSRDIYIIANDNGKKGTTQITLYLSYDTDLIFKDGKILPEVLEQDDVVAVTFNVTIE